MQDKVGEPRAQPVTVGLRSISPAIAAARSGAPAGSLGSGNTNGVMRLGA
ncbi:hypothetical protein BZL30_4693 [Mycobacterium kansasii]|uniref:Uncharacterized protein n=1 Tax=Mycobacterium kansasii TaxID=1768 RepID=A0A1V3X3R9_MYCKA|nr:hypothetical protein BZL30_4693 [Mycobacterium kansasii]